MIYFNATFFVQILHFLFAWWVLRQFLFRPVVSVIHHEKGLDARLNSKVVAEQAVLEKSQKEQSRQWSWYQQQFKKRIPESIVRTAISVRSFKKIDPSHISAVAQERDCALLTDLVVSRFSHD